MSPEQSQGRSITPSTDLYSLAAVVFFAWTGKPPFEVRTAAEAATMTNGSPPRLSERARHGQISPEIDAAMSLALDKRPEQRPHSAMELADTIRNGFIRQPCGTEGLLAAAQGQTTPKRVSVRTSAPTAVIRPTGGRVQPAASGPSAFVGATPTAVNRIGQKTLPVAEAQAVIPHPKRGANFGEIRLVVIGVLLSSALIWATLSLR
jgi:serine/threonine protein kinase